MGWGGDGVGLVAWVVVSNTPSKFYQFIVIHYVQRTGLVIALPMAATSSLPGPAPAEAAIPAVEGSCSVTTQSLCTAFPKTNFKVLKKP